MPSRIAKTVPVANGYNHRNHRSKKALKGKNTKFKRNQRLILTRMKALENKKLLRSLRKAVDTVA